VEKHPQHSKRIPSSIAVDKFRGPQGDPQCRRLGQILERPDDRAIRGGDLAGKALPGGAELIPTVARSNLQIGQT